MPDSTADATKPIRAADVAPTAFSHGDRFAMRFRHLAEACGAQPYKIGVALEELPAGKQTCPAHYHTIEEEHVFVLSGALTVRIGKERYVMQAGDYVRFPAGATDEHCLFNHTDAVCSYLIIGDRSTDDVCVYPDSGKIMVRATGEIYDKTETRDYWDGEA